MHLNNGMAMPLSSPWIFLTNTSGRPQDLQLKLIGKSVFFTLTALYFSPFIWEQIDIRSVTSVVKRAAGGFKDAHNGRHEPD